MEKKLNKLEQELGIEIKSLRDEYAACIKRLSDSGDVTPSAIIKELSDSLNAQELAFLVFEDSIKVERLHKKLETIGNLIFEQPENIRKTKKFDA